MTTDGPPPAVAQPPPQLPPVPRRRSVLRGVVSSGVLALSAAAAVFTAVMLFHNRTPVTDTVVIVPPGPPSFSDAEVAAAKQDACAAWNQAVPTVVSASAAAGNAPKSWDDPATKDAIAAEARTALVEIAYLRGQVDPATPPVVAGPIRDYVIATFDQEDAAMRRVGTQVDSAIGRENSSVDRVNAACGLK